MCGIWEDRDGETKGNSAHIDVSNHLSVLMAKCCWHLTIHCSLNSMLFLSHQPWSVLSFFFSLYVSVWKCVTVLTCCSQYVLYLLAVSFPFSQPSFPFTHYNLKFCVLQHFALSTGIGDQTDQIGKFHQNSCLCPVYFLRPSGERAPHSYGFDMFICPLSCWLKGGDWVISDVISATHIHTVHTCMFTLSEGWRAF